MKISKDKKYKTVNGSEVAIYAIYEGQMRPLVGSFKNTYNEWIPASWDINGRFRNNQINSPLDLVEVDPLEEAKERYPHGTVFICARDCEKEKVYLENKGDDYWVSGNFNDDILASISDDEGAYIKYEGQWAEIVSKPSEVTKEQVIEYLKKNLEL